MWRKLLDALPHGHYLAEEDWQRRHRLMLWILGLHVPALVVLGLVLGYTPRTLTLVMIAPLALVGLGHLLRHYRRAASVTVTVGLVYCSAALVVLTHGTIEAHFHFFVIIGFIALYQDWAPFLCNVVFTVVSHGIGSVWQKNLIFEHAPGQANPWLWSSIHGVAVLVACAGALLVLRVTEDTQRDKDVLARRLADSEINRRQFTSDLLTNLARRNQSLLRRQLEIINQLEETERDPDALADLFSLDHIATRVRRNAENLLVLAGDQPPRTWSEPVPLRDVLRAAIAETENLERVVFVVDEQSAVVGHTVIDLTHLLAELTENAVRFSPPDTTVTVRSRPDRARPGGRLITIEDWGLGMPADQIEQANALLATPPDVDVAVSQRLGFHVVARLAARHGIKVGLSVTPGSGTTALLSLPPSLFAALHPSAAAAAPPPLRAAANPKPSRRVAGGRATATPPAAEASRAAAPRRMDFADWGGWWDPAVASAMPAFNPSSSALNGAGPILGDPSAGPGVGFGSASASANGHGTNGRGGSTREPGDGTGPRPAAGRPADHHRPTTNGGAPASNVFGPIATGRNEASRSGAGPSDSGPIDLTATGASLFGGTPSGSPASESGPIDSGPTGRGPTGIGPTGMCPTGMDPTGIGPLGPLSPVGGGQSRMSSNEGRPSKNGPIDLTAADAALFDGSQTGSAPSDSGPIDSGPIDVGPIGLGPSDGPIGAGLSSVSANDRGAPDGGAIGRGPDHSGPIGRGPDHSGPIGRGPDQIGPIGIVASDGGPIGISAGSGGPGGGAAGVLDLGGRGDGAGGYARPFGPAAGGGDGIVLEPGTSTPTYRVSTAAARVGEARRPSPSPHPAVVDAPPMPVATVPDPRGSGPVDPVSGLRRRIPQAHLSAQLRSPEPDDPQPAFHRPSTAEAAAALSRYQASRAAAQARMGDAPKHDPATTTPETADGGHA